MAIQFKTAAEFERWKKLHKINDGSSDVESVEIHEETPQVTGHPILLFLLAIVLLLLGVRAGFEIFKKLFT